MHDNKAIQSRIIIGSSGAFVSVMPAISPLSSRTDEYEGRVGVWSDRGRVGLELPIRFSVIFFFQISNRQ